MTAPAKPAARKSPAAKPTAAKRAATTRKTAPSKAAVSASVEAVVVEVEVVAVEPEPIVQAVAVEAVAEPEVVAEVVAVAVEAVADVVEPEPIVEAIAASSPKIAKVATRPKKPAAPKPDKSKAKASTTSAPAPRRAKRPAEAVPVIAQPTPVIESGAGWTEPPVKPKVERRDPSLPVPRYAAVADDWDTDASPAAAVTAVAASAVASAVAVAEPELVVAPAVVAEPEPEPVAVAAIIVAPEPEPVVADPEPVVAEVVAPEPVAVIAEPAVKPMIKVIKVAAAPVRVAKPVAPPAPAEPIAAVAEVAQVAAKPARKSSLVSVIPVLSVKEYVAAPVVLAPPPEPVVVEAEPVVVEAVVAEPEPVVFEPEPEPVVAEVVAAEPEPIVVEPEPVVAEVVAAAPDPEPVVAAAVIVTPAKPKTSPARKVPAARPRPQPRPRTAPVPVQTGAQASTTVAAFCPYCALALDPAPTASRRCTRCRQRIVVKRVQSRIVYLTEAAVEVFESERLRSLNFGRWSKERAAWLKLARSVRADTGRIGRIAEAPLSEGIVASAKNLYLTTADRQFRDAKQEYRWEDASQLKRDQAVAMHRLAGSPVPPTFEVVAVHRDAVTAELRGIGRMAKDASLVGSDCCDACRADDGRTYKIATELRDHRLPHEGCPRGLCQCRWDLTMRDRDMVQRYLKRTVRGPRPKAPTA